MTFALSFLLAISVSLNIILVWYIRKIISQLYYFIEEVSDLESQFDSFDGHLKSIYELETFYGDDTLDGLIRHSKDLLESVANFRKNVSIEDEDEERDCEENEE